MSYFDERVARSVDTVAQELRRIRRALESIDERLAKQNETEVVLKKEEPRRGVFCAVEPDGTPCTGCRPRPCIYELKPRGGLGNG